MMQRKNNTAFTLVEVMIVVAIIGVLAMITVPMFIRAKVNANHSAAKTTLKTVGTALESYAADYRAYPADTAILKSARPEYLTTDYFDGAPHSGYIFSAVLSDYDYTVTATPFSPSTGTKTFTLNVGSIISQN